MKKIVIKTTLITLATVIVLLAVAFGIASLGFPKNMSQICENMGNYKLAASYAEQQYNRTENTEDLYRCARLYIRLEDDEKIVKYCEILVDKQDFKECCGNNVQHIYGKYATALYRSRNTDKALEIAEKSVADGFCIPNAYAELTVQAVEKQDKAFGKKLLDSFSEVDKPQGEAELNYYNAIMSNLENLSA